MVKMLEFENVSGGFWTRFTANLNDKTKTKLADFYCTQNFDLLQFLKH